MIEVKLQEQSILELADNGKHFCLSTRESEGGPLLIRYSRSMEALARSIKAHVESHAEPDLKTEPMASESENTAVSRSVSIASPVSLPCSQGDDGRDKALCSTSISIPLSANGTEPATDPPAEYKSGRVPISASQTLDNTVADTTIGLSSMRLSSWRLSSRLAVDNSMHDAATETLAFQLDTTVKHEPVSPPVQEYKTCETVEMAVSQLAEDEGQIENDLVDVRTAADEKCPSDIASLGDGTHFADSPAGTVDPALLHSLEHDAFTGDASSRPVGVMSVYKSSMQPAVKAEEIEFSTIREKGIHMILDSLKQLRCRALAKIWIKIIEPKKQANFPYAKDRIPSWWPAKVRHKEPDHLLKKERIDLLTWLIFKFPHLHSNFLATARAHDPDNAHLYSRLFTVCGSLYIESTEEVSWAADLITSTAENQAEEENEKVYTPLEEELQEKQDEEQDEELDQELNEELEQPTSTGGTIMSPPTPVDPDLFYDEFSSRSSYTSHTPAFTGLKDPWPYKPGYNERPSTMFRDVLQEPLGEYSEMYHCNGYAPYEQRRPVLARGYGPPPGLQPAFAHPMAFFLNPSMNYNLATPLPNWNSPRWSNGLQLPHLGLPTLPPMQLPPYMNAVATNPFYTPPIGLEFAHGMPSPGPSRGSVQPLKRASSALQSSPVARSAKRRKSTAEHC